MMTKVVYNTLQLECLVMYDTRTIHHSMFVAMFVAEEEPLFALQVLVTLTAG